VRTMIPVVSAWTHDTLIAEGGMHGLVDKCVSLTDFSWSGVWKLPVWSTGFVIGRVPADRPGGDGPRFSNTLRIMVVLAVYRLGSVTNRAIYMMSKILWCPGFTSVAVPLQTGPYRCDEG
jgi:hypothetical protein